jgi:hypothetical protein
VKEHEDRWKMRARGALALRSLSLRSRIGMQPLRKVKCVAIYLRHTRVSRNFTHSRPHALALGPLRLHSHPKTRNKQK